MLQLRNTSPFVPTIFATPDRRGVDTIVVVLKASFVVADTLEIAAEQRPITLADEYWGDPTASSLRYPTELHLPKPAADVIVIGEACAPRAQAVTELDVHVRVADQLRRARVYGDRSWVEYGGHVQPSRPLPFVRTPITWERAFGGRHLSDAQSTEHRNPVGVGLLGARRPQAMIGQPVPNVDDPDEPLTWLGQTPTPTGFAAIAPTWQPRVAYAGSYDASWRKHQAPFLPTDFDPRFFCSAAPGHSFASGLHGGEPVTLSGFDADRAWQFALPRCRFEVRAVVAGATNDLNPVLDTVLIETTNDHHLSVALTWRASLAVDEQLLRVSHVDVGLAELSGATEPRGSKQ
ncbi:DUF2169 family type VI secretion system accessory protein [Enhygromyxa salina]|uniref:DUF2169 domain-containing protein n=1 Tax=Enhygromyxa salina TaxID=215803 RepID=A0A2S9YVT4_9BACT|nr:DUF2169 domain-containing protein [Enhygromyxa salina]PRQ09207.1 hypothetical protein ENSA7_11970 [Enhygromyxa salina]